MTSRRSQINQENLRCLSAHDRVIGMLDNLCIDQGVAIILFDPCVMQVTRISASCARGYPAQPRFKWERLKDAR